MEEKWRKELKYTVTEGESIVTARRLSSLMQRDKNLKGGREYLIRSLYFDNLYEKVLKEKLSGTAIRDKFRIRYYDFDTAFIRLEKKSKRYAVGHKYQCRLTAEEVQKIIDGDLAWMETDERPLVWELFLKMKLELFRPSVIVDYCREPFTYAPGNVRVTFDCNLCTGLSADAFLDDAALALCSSPAQGGIILEVKYDEFLPDVIRTVVQPYCSRLQAFSKYAQCRSFG